MIIETEEHFKMRRKQISVKFMNGLDGEEFIRDVLWVVSDSFEIIPDTLAKCIIFGPYGPPVDPGDYIRVGYFCENIIPNMDACDWAFGVPYEEEIGHPRYKRIEWHGIRPDHLSSPQRRAEFYLTRRFCNFVYSQPYPYREQFFRALGGYKHVDAPGQSMNNMPSLDDAYAGVNMWDRKRTFLSHYKFTIAFENFSYRGYNTEKLTDPLLAGSVPIYLGNPEIARHFNPDCFINAHDYLPSRRSLLVELIERNARESFRRGGGFSHRAMRRVRGILRALKMDLEFGTSFDRLVSRIREVDRDDELYLKILTSPRLNTESERSVESLRKRWTEIFTSVSPAGAG